MSIGQLDDSRYKVIFSSKSFHITKGNMVIVKGNKVASLYPLLVHKKEHLLTCIWHGRLGHMSRGEMETLSLFGYLPVLSVSNFQFVNIVNMVNKKEVYIKFILILLLNPWI